MIREQEITCAKGYIPALAVSSRYIVVNRELFPDGKVNVTWDPGHKYGVSTSEVQR